MNTKYNINATYTLHPVRIYFFLLQEISGSFLCGGSLPRLPKSTICDGYPDCPFGEDEIGCEDSKRKEEDRMSLLPKENSVAKYWTPMSLSVDPIQHQSYEKSASKLQFNPFAALNVQEKLKKVPQKDATKQDCKNTINGKCEDEIVADQVLPELLDTFNPFEVLSNQPMRKPRLRNQKLRDDFLLKNTKPLEVGDTEKKVVPTLKHGIKPKVTSNVLQTSTKFNKDTKVKDSNWGEFRLEDQLHGRISQETTTVRPTKGSFRIFKALPKEYPTQMLHVSNTFHLSSKSIKKISNPT